jgi:hypothetical protein
MCCVDGLHALSAAPRGACHDSEEAIFLVGYPHCEWQRGSALTTSTGVANDSLGHQCISIAMRNDANVTILPMLCVAQSVQQCC